jgi:nucleotide-binding universal stress UspA family protein
MKLICPTDFSRSATEAADVAAAIAARRKQPLKLVYCAIDRIVGADATPLFPETQMAPERLEQETRRLSSSGIEVSSSFLRGPEHVEIVRVAQDDADMIVMGSTGIGGAERWLLGSVSERVAESAPVPTLVVRKAEPLLAWLREGRPLRVLCAVDFTMSADAALATVKHLMDLGPIGLEAAYVSCSDEAGATFPPGESSPERKQMVERDIWERVQQALGCEEIKIHCKDASDNPAFSFVRLADERKADLVVVGAHQAHGLKRLVSPSFSRSVLKHSAANILCVPLSSYKPEFQVPKMDRVLVAADFSANTENVIQHGCGLLPAGGSMRLLHVCGEPRPGIDPFVAAQVYFERSIIKSRETTAAEEKLYSIAPRQMATAGVDMSVRALQSNDVAGAICESADEYGADVICMGAGKHSAVSKAVLGSMVEQVVAKSHRPVLVVPPPAR